MTSQSNLTRKKKTFSELDGGDDEDEDGDEVKENKPEKDEKNEDNVSTEMVGAVTAANNSPTIDNPYLRAAKIPRKV